MYHVKTAEGFMQRSMMSEKMYLVVDGLRHVNKLSTKMCSGGKGRHKTNLPWQQAGYIYGREILNFNSKS